MTGLDIQKKLDSFNNLIQELGVSTFSSKEIWNRKKEIDENFRAAQFEQAEEKEKVTANFQLLVQLIHTKEKEVEQANEAFTVNAEELIASFEQNAKNILGKTTIEKEDFKTLRTQANEAFDYFKQQRWASKDRRTIAWDIYNLNRNLVKDREDEVMAKEREEKNKLASQSLEVTEKVCVVINACHPTIAAEELQNYVIKLNQFLQKNGFENEYSKWFLIEKPDEVKLALKSRSETLNDVRNFVLANRDNFLREHKGQIFANIDAVKEDLNKAWDLHKIDQQKRQEEWEIKKKERDEKRVEWTKKQQEFLEFLERRLENQTQYKAKQESYWQSQKEYAKRFESRIPAQQEYIKRLVEQVIDLEKKHATAWTDSFKTKVEEWIAEKKEKIVNVETDIEVLKEKVLDINKNIDSFPQKIADLEESIKEIEVKIFEVKSKLENDKYLAITANEDKPKESLKAIKETFEEQVTTENNTD